VFLREHLAPKFVEDSDITLSLERGLNGVGMIEALASFDAGLMWTQPKASAKRLA
jgi:hypothetical protein